MATSIRGSNIQTFKAISDRNLLILWLLVNIVTLTLGWTNLVTFAIMGAVAAGGQWIILRWALGISWPWIIIGPIVWFYSLYGSPVLGALFLPLVGGEFSSHFYPFLVALIPGILIGFCEFLLFRRRLHSAALWIPIHAFALAASVTISPFALDMSWQMPTAFTLIRGLISTLCYSILTSAALVLLRHKSLSAVA
jgi:hypothetical protein